jgi:hypothetical protein
MNSPPKRKRRRQAPLPKPRQQKLFPEERESQQPCFSETPLGRWLNRERRLARLAQEGAAK